MSANVTKTPRKQKRICMVAYTHYRSDPRCRREAEALVERGDEVDFLCLGTDDEPTTETIAGVKVRRIPMKRYRGDSARSYLLSYALFFLRVSLLLGVLGVRRRFNVVHVHSMPDEMVFVALVPKLFGAKVILDLHELSSELYADRFGLSAGHPMLKLLLMAERASVKWAHRVICVHEPQAAQLTSRCKFRYEPCVLMNVPDSHLFRRRPETLESPAGDVFKLVHHGTLVQRYGVDIAIGALKEIGNAMPEAELFIYGNGDFLPELRKEISRLGLGTCVHLSGERLPLEAMASAIGDAQIGIVPHRDGPIMRWALPTKMMEYIALGIPVIVARTEVVQKYFDDSMVMFFKPGDPSDLARCILKLYKEPELRHSLSHNASKFLETHSWDKEKEKLFSLVDGL